MGIKEISSDQIRTPDLAPILKTTKLGHVQTAHAQKKIGRFWTSSDLSDHEQKREKKMNVSNKPPP